MPNHKINRTEEVSTENWIEILDLAAKLDYSNAKQTPPFQLWLSAVLAIDWLTGKRINEILRLKRRDISFTTKLIQIRFLVGKKRARAAPIELQPYQKSRTIEHKAIKYIQQYLEEYDTLVKNRNIVDRENQLFPAATQPRNRIINTTFTNGKQIEETRQYNYSDPGGYIYEEHARYWLKKINAQLPPSKQIYFHYGRHNIGIKMAYQGHSDLEIAKILDETPKAAIEYTKHASGLGANWTQETE